MHRTLTYYLDRAIDKDSTLSPALSDVEVEIIASESNSTKLSFYSVDPTDATPREFKVVSKGTFVFTKTAPSTLNDLSVTDSYVTEYSLYIIRGGEQQQYYKVQYSSPLRIDDPLLEMSLGINAVDDEIVSLAPSAQNDWIRTYAGNDRIKPLYGDDYVNGGDGIDTLILSGNRSEYDIGRGGNIDDIFVTDRVTSRDGSDWTSSVERFEFLDKSLAFDMDGHAGIVAKTLGAVFGAQSISNETYVGIGLGLLEDGMTYETLMALALQVRLGAGYSIADEVRLLEGNVYGRAAPAASISFWENHGSSRGLIGINYAESGVNIDNVDLVGLSDSGLGFV